MSGKPRILFLCTGNSCRSQMAEAWVNNLMGDRFEAHSAGTMPSAVDLRAIQVMAEAGIDISKNKSKDIDEFNGQDFDYVITLCDNAREACPFFPARTRVMHRGFDDPPRLAAAAHGEEEIMASYRRVRDDIKEFVEGLPQELAGT